jgi:hypothetical protein
LVLLTLYCFGPSSLSSSFGVPPSSFGVSLPPSSFRGFLTPSSFDSSSPQVLVLTSSHRYQSIDKSNEYIDIVPRHEVAEQSEVEVFEDQPSRDCDSMRNARGQQIAQQSLSGHAINTVPSPRNRLTMNQEEAIKKGFKVQTGVANRAHNCQTIWEELV